MSEPQESNNNYDVVVIGGGSAGFCAAIAAARQGGQGSRVALIEKSDRLGGMGPLAFVHTFCGLYHPDTSMPPRVANAGLPAEIEAAIRQRTGQEAPTAMGRVYVLHQHPEIYDQLAKELVAAEGESLDCMMESECIDITRESDGGFAVEVLTTGGIRPMRCRSVVDCSADALGADLLGATRLSEESDRLQKPAFIFSLKNVGKEVREERFKMRLALDLVHGVGTGQLPGSILGATVRESVHKGECFISMDLDTDKTQWNPSNPAAVAEIERTGRDLAMKLYTFLQVQYPFFEEATEPEFPPSIGVRESFRWLGRHVLTGQELVDGVSFPDTVANATWPLEMREDAKGAKFTYFKNARASGIPLRALVSAEIPGVYFAGRCISATHEALASVRVMGTCFATGQAAGMASMCYAQGTKGLDAQARMIQGSLNH
ncbi:MAG: FAD-dependent oxidoreductase [Akkermansiaceae bacterium]|nr:FAD-dependent oxidoreductase [Akkermansiaceae bacterium]